MTEDLIFVDEKVQEANQTSSDPQIQINAKGISSDFIERYRQEQEKKQKEQEQVAKRKMEQDSSIFQAKLKAEKVKSLNSEKEKAAMKSRQLEKAEYWKRLEDIRKRGIKGPTPKSPEIKITGSGKSESKDPKLGLKKNNQSNIPPKLPPTPKYDSENDEKLATAAAKKQETIYKCSNCQKLFNTLTSIRQHDCAVQAQAAKKQSQQAEKSKQETEKSIKNPSSKSASASDEVTIYKCSLCEKPFLTLPEVKNHTCSQTKPPQNKNGNQSGAAKKDVTIYKCSLCQKPFLTIQEARNHDCPAQQKTAKKPEQKPKSTQIQSPKPSQSPKPATLQTTPPVANKPTFNKWAENHGKKSSSPTVAAAKKPDPTTDEIEFVDCGFDDEANETQKEPQLLEKSQTQDQAADQSMVFVDVAETFDQDETSAAAENTKENQDNPKQPTTDHQADINAALSNEFLFDFVDCSDEFIGFEENESTEDHQKQVEKTVETNQKQIEKYATEPSSLSITKITQQSKEQSKFDKSPNPYKKISLTGEVNNSPNPSKKIRQTDAVEVDKRKEIDNDDVVFDNQREVDNQILYPVDDEDESGGSIKIGQKMPEKANNQKEVSKLVQKIPEKATPKTVQKETKDSGRNKSPFSNRYDQVENELEAMFAGIDQKTPEKANVKKKPVVRVATEGNNDSYLPEREFVHDMDFDDSGIY